MLSAVIVLVAAAANASSVVAGNASAAQAQGFGSSLPPVTWDYSLPLTAGFLILLGVNFLVGLALGNIGKRLIGVGMWLLLLIIVLTVYAGVTMKYSGVVEDIISTATQYMSVLFTVVAGHLPWTGAVFLFGFAEGFWDLRIFSKWI